MDKYMSKEEFFRMVRQEGRGLEFDDVLLLPGHAEVLPKDVSTTTLFSRNVPLNIPLVSAAMDTVTEKGMAIGMAEAGGIGVIHRNLNPHAQAEQVRRVKFRFVRGIIERPICANKHETLASVMKRIEGKEFSGVPVVDDEEKLVGILTKNQFRLYAGELEHTRVWDAMVTSFKRAPANTSLEDAAELMKREVGNMLPLVDEERKVAGLYVTSDIGEVKSGRSRSNNTDANGQLRVAAAVGVVGQRTADAGGEEFRIELLVKSGVDALVVDAAHGDSHLVEATVQYIKERFSVVDVIAGNIVTEEAALRLIDAGADALKVGIGSSPVCTTRTVAGVGAKQLTAIYECARIADMHGIPVIADGGIKSSGDIVKAIAAGAHAVMIGTLFAGTEEAPGARRTIDGREYKVHRGMGSLGAMREHAGSRARYSQEDIEEGHVVPEGIETLMSYKGKVTNVIQQLVGGLRAGMGYVGVRDIGELRRNVLFQR